MTHPALEAVAELIRTQTMRIEFDDIPALAYKLRAPCLLAQLATLVGVGSETGGRGVPGSRPTVNVDAIDLWTEIVTATAAWCQHLGIDRKPLRSQATLRAVDPDTDTETPAAGKLLRSCAATAISRGHTEVADRIRASATTWTHRITAMLTGHHEQRGVRGAACPECAATTVVDLRDEGDRQVRYRVPAIALVVRETLRWVVCNACGWHQLLGESLDETAGQAA